MRVALSRLPLEFRSTCLTFLSTIFALVSYYVGKFLHLRDWFFLSWRVFLRCVLRLSIGERAYEIYQATFWGVIKHLFYLFFTNLDRTLSWLLGSRVFGIDLGKLGIRMFYCYGLSIRTNVIIPMDTTDSAIKDPTIVIAGIRFNGSPRSRVFHFYGAHIKLAFHIHVSDRHLSWELKVLRIFLVMSFLAKTIVDLVRVWIQAFHRVLPTNLGDFEVASMFWVGSHLLSKFREEDLGV